MRKRCRELLEAADDLAHAALISGLFSETGWTLGRLGEALAEARRSVELARRSGAAELGGPEPVGGGQDPPPPRRTGEAAAAAFCEAEPGDPGDVPPRATCRAPAIATCC